MKQDVSFQAKAAMIGRMQVATSLTSMPVNRTGFEYARVLINCGALADTGDVTILIRHSDTSGGTYETLVAHPLVVSGGGANDNSVVTGRVRLHGVKAFIQAEAAVNAGSGATGNHTVFVTADLYPGQYVPEDAEPVDFEFDGFGPGASTS